MRGAIFIVMVLWLAGCGGPPSALVGLEGSVDPATVPGASKVEVFVATSRAPSEDAHTLFSGERSSTVAFAHLTVWIPPNHQTGQIERTKTLPPDPRTDFVITNPLVFDKQAEFVRDVDRDLATRPPADRNVLIFVHGYNTDFTSAVLRIAQFVHDSGYKGTPVLFTWASRGRTLDYVYDLNSTLHARDGMLEAAIAITNETNARQVDILAHSMGNFLTVEAMRQQALRGQFNARGRINSVILAAPDIDIDLFQRQLDWLRPDQLPVYVLVSADDKALGLSRRIAGNVERVGQARPEELAGLGLNVIDLSAVEDTESIHHTKFAGAPEVVQLIGEGILAGAALPESEGTESPLEVLGGAAADILVLPATVLSGGRIRASH
ncbi:MAG: alpha/beta hydrolase [Acuticoccus sp.]